jgi:hypothetical protein
MFVNNLPPGTYYLRVRTLATATAGYYHVELTCVEQPCDLACPPGGTPEGEVIVDSNYVDHYNGGCNSTPNIWQTVTCGQTICGLSGTWIKGGYFNRDTDWYEVTVAGTSDLVITGNAEFLSYVFLLQPPCPGTTIQAVAFLPCDNIEVRQTVTAGTYWVVFMPGQFAGVPIGSAYNLTIDCITPGEDCGVPIIIPSIPYTDTRDNSIYVNDYTDHSGPDVVYEFTLAAEATLNISLCNTVPVTFDTWLGVWAQADCGGANIIAEDDDSCVPSGFGASTIENLTLAAGTYDIMVDTWYGAMGTYVLDVTFGVPPEPPPNDDCVDVTPVPLPDGTPLTFTGDNTYATNDCPLSDGAQVWFAFTTDMCMDVRIDFCGTSPSLNWVSIVMTHECPCDTPWVRYTDANWTDCTDGNPTVIFNSLPAGTYYYGMISNPAQNPTGPYTCHILGIHCPAPVFTVSPEAIFDTVLTDSVASQGLVVGNVGVDPMRVMVSTSQNTGLAAVYPPNYQTVISRQTAILSNVTGQVAEPKKISSRHPASPPDPMVILQGGDNIGSATPIPDLPFHDTGTTIGYTNDYNGSCGQAAGGAPDVVYSYSAAADVTVNITLCNGSNFDSRLYVYDGSPSTEVACNDDGCAAGGPSKIVGLALVAGHNYYIVIDGWNTEQGDYTIDMYAVAPVECPPGGVQEGEPDCYTDYMDRTNGGCNSNPPVFGSITSGETICGSSGIYSASGTPTRDTDWYLLNIANPTLITVTCVAEFPVTLGIIKPYSADPCDNSGFLTWYVQLDPSQSGSLTAMLDPAFPYVIWVAPQSTTVTAPCGSNYVISLQCSRQWLYTDAIDDTLIVQPAGSADVMVTMDAGIPLTPGHYTGNVYFSTNEQGLVIHDVPIDFTVNPSGPACHYIPGDVNNSGVFNGIDVTYAVGYFKGGPVPPYSCPCPPPNVWYVAGDVNGSCVFNGIDVTYMVAYFKGGPAPIPCPDCPPVPQVAPAPGETPAVQPLLNGKTSAEEGGSQQ